MTFCTTPTAARAPALAAVGRRAALTLATLLAVVAPATVAAAADVPYTDPGAHGHIGLCDGDTKATESGSTATKPFVGTAGSSQAAPSSVQGSGQKATLYVFVPQQGVDPTSWPSLIMSGTTDYSDADHPTAAMTRLDVSLDDVIKQLPPQWDGLYELRLYFSAPNHPVGSAGYAATDIQVSGSTWKVVRGGDVDCGAGQAVSNEERVPGLLSSPSPLVPAYINGRPNPAAFPDGVPSVSPPAHFDPEQDAASPTPAPTGAAASGGTGSAAPGAVTTTPSPGSTQASDAASTRSHSSSSSSTGTVLVIVLGGLVLVGGAGFAAGRRRGASR